MDYAPLDITEIPLFFVNFAHQAALHVPLKLNAIAANNQCLNFKVEQPVFARIVNSITQ